MAEERESQRCGMWPRLRLLYSCCGCAQWPLLTVLGSFIILRPLIGFVLTTSGLVTMFYLVSKPPLFFDYPKTRTLLSLSWVSSLTIILAVPQVLFNFSNLWYVQSTPTHYVPCASSSHTPDSAAPADCEHDDHAFVSPERHVRRPYSHSSLCSGHPTSEISMYAPYRMLHLNDIINLRYAYDSTN